MREIKFISEISFKERLDFFINILLPKDAYNATIVTAAGMMSESDILDVIQYENLFSEKAVLESRIKMYVEFPYSDLKSKKEWLVSKLNEIQTNMFRGNTRLSEIKAVNEKKERYAAVVDKMSMFENVLTDLKSLRQKLEDMNAETQNLIQQGKGSMAERNMEKVEDLTNRISDLEYQKATVADEIIYLRKGMDGTEEKLDGPDIKTVSEEMLRMESLQKKIEDEIKHWDSITSQGSSTHNSHLVFIQRLLEQVTTKVNEKKKAYDSFRSACETIGLLQNERLFGLFNRFGEHRVLLGYMIKNPDIFDTKFVPSFFDDISQKMFKELLEVL